MNIEEDDLIFQFLISFVESLILNLSNEEEREAAIKWIQKITTSRKTSLRLKYLKFILFMLQMGRLICPFDVDVDVNAELEDMPEDVTDRDLFNYAMIKITGKSLPKGRSSLPVMSTLTENEQVFQAVQLMPNVGIRCYFAASPLPIKHWFKPCGFRVPPRTDERTANEAVKIFTDFVQVQMRRILDEADVHTTIPTTPFPRFYDPDQRTPATTGLPITVPPPPTRLVPRRRPTTDLTREHLVDVEEPEYDVRPVEDYNIGDDLIDVEYESPSETTPPSICGILKELESIFPCPRTTPTTTPQPGGLVCPRHLSQPSSPATTLPMNDVVTEFEDISNETIDRRCPLQRTGTEDYDKKYRGQEQLSSQEKRPLTSSVPPSDVSSRQIVGDEDRPITARSTGRYEFPDEVDQPIPADQWSDEEPLQKIIDALLIEPLQIRIKTDFADMYKACKCLPVDYVITWDVRKDFMQLTRAYLFDVFQTSDLPSARFKGTPGFPVQHDYDNPSYSQNVILRMIVVDNLYSVVSSLSPEQLDFFLDFIQEYPYNRPRHLTSSANGELGSTRNLDRIIPMPDTGGHPLPLPRPLRMQITTTPRPTTMRPAARTARRVAQSTPKVRSGTTKKKRNV